MQEIQDRSLPWKSIQLRCTFQIPEGPNSWNIYGIKLFNGLFLPQFRSSVFPSRWWNTKTENHPPDIWYHPRNLQKNPDGFHKLARCPRNPTGDIRVPNAHHRAARTHNYTGISKCVTRLARLLFIFFLPRRLRASEQVSERGWGWTLSSSIMVIICSLPPR